MKQIGFQPIKKKKKSVYPNQYICDKHANGIACNGNFYPYKAINYNWADTPTLFDVVPAIKGTRIYLETVNKMKMKTTAAGNQGFYLKCYLLGVETAINEIFEAAVSTYSWAPNSFYLGLLLDENTSLYVELQSATIATIQIQATYCYVDVLPGELQPKVIEE